MSNKKSNYAFIRDFSDIFEFLLDFHFKHIKLTRLEFYRAYFTLKTVCR
jgi:hypothetical protein